MNDTEQPKLNPYASPAPIVNEPGLFMMGGHRSGKGLLHRRIAFTKPIAAELDYDGKYFRQRIYISRRLVWHCISWSRIHPVIDFVWPGEFAGVDTPGRIVIDFGRTLSIKRFTVYFADQIIYDETQ